MGGVAKAALHYFALFCDSLRDQLCKVAPHLFGSRAVVRLTVTVRAKAGHVRLSVYSLLGKWHNMVRLKVHPPIPHQEPLFPAQFTVAVRAIQYRGTHGRAPYKSLADNGPSLRRLAGRARN